MQSTLIAGCSLNSQWSFLLSQMYGPSQIRFTGHWSVFGWFFQCLRLFGTYVCVLLPTLTPATFLVEYSLVLMQTFSRFQCACRILGYSLVTPVLCFMRVQFTKGLGWASFFFPLTQGLTSNSGCSESHQQTQGGLELNEIHLPKGVCPGWVIGFREVFVISSCQMLFFWQMVLQLMSLQSSRRGAKQSFSPSSGLPNVNRVYAIDWLQLFGVVKLHGLRTRTHSFS